MENSQNDDGMKSTGSQSSISEKIQDYILEHLLTVMWSFSLLIGGFIFWRYFFHIDYFPDLNFQEVALLLVATALLGFVYAFVADFILLLPAIMYCLFSWDGVASDDKKNNQKKNSADVDKYFGRDRRSLSFFAGIFLIEWILFLFIFDMWKELLWGLAVAGLVIFLISIFRRIKKLNVFLEEISQKQKFGLVLQWIMVLIFVTFIFWVGFVKIFGDLNNNDGVLYSLFLFIFVNFLVAFLWGHPEKPRVYWFFLLAGIVFLTLVILPVPQYAIAQFHFGNFPAEHFLVDKQGCKIFNHYGLAPESDVSGKSDECLYKNMTILLRLGREFRLEKEITKDKTIVFNVPKKNVLSWSIVKPKKENGSNEDSNTETKK